MEGLTLSVNITFNKRMETKGLCSRMVYLHVKGVPIVSGEIAHLFLDLLIPSVWPEPRVLASLSLQIGMPKVLKIKTKWIRMISGN